MKFFIFLVKIKNIDEIGCNNEILNKRQLQESEVDWAGFMTPIEANERIFFRFKPILSLI